MTFALNRIIVFGKNDDDNNHLVNQYF